MWHLTAPTAGRGPNCSSLMRINMPGAVAGCPPDGFSATGQLWGNPLYNWEYHRKTGYAWWMRRMEYCFCM
ncbi:MAG: 4-alpha-glucanotransferase [Enterocloster bolteae]